MNKNAPTFKKAEPNKPNKGKRSRPLTENQKLFCIAYVKLRAEGRENGTQACRNAGYRGNERTLRKTAHELLKSPTIQEHIAEIIKEAERVPVVPGLARFRHIMGINETLGRTSFLARATLDDVLDEEGKFDLDKARQTGGIHAIKRLRIRTNTRRYKDGTEDVTVTHEVELRDKNSSVELMGRHLGLWDDDEDPREVLERLLGIPKSQLPAKADALVHPISEDEEDERPAS